MTNEPPRIDPLTGLPIVSREHEQPPPEWPRDEMGILWTHAVRVAAWTGGPAVLAAAGVALASLVEDTRGITPSDAFVAGGCVGFVLGVINEVDRWRRERRTYQERRN